jgi:thiol-disulfide isomerase/thioredoxin
MNLKNIVLSVLLLAIFLFVAFMFLKRTETFSSGNVISYYYLPQCGWCKKFTPNWEKFEEQVKKENLPVTTRKVDASDSENEKEVSEKGITGFPHVQMNNGKEEVAYDGDRTVADLLKFVTDNLSL